MENRIKFILQGKKDKSVISRKNIPLSLLSEFFTTIEKFVQNSTNVTTSIEEGSFKVTLSNIAVQEKSIIDSELDSYSNNTLNLNNVEEHRVKPYQEFKKILAKIEDPKLVIESHKGKTKVKEISITPKTKYIDRQSQEVDVELYVYGHIYEMGGKDISNIHIKVEDDSTVIVDIESDKLQKDEKNRLYKDMMLRVRAKQNIITKKYSNYEFIEYTSYQPSDFNKEKHQNLVQKIKPHFTDIPDTVSYQRWLRGKISDEEYKLLSKKQETNDKKYED